MAPKQQFRDGVSVIPRQKKPIIPPILALEKLSTEAKLASTKI
jgi:hypothetical protein